MQIPERPRPREGGRVARQHPCATARLRTGSLTHLLASTAWIAPRGAVRQWMLSLPFALRYRLAYDASLTTALLGMFVRTVFASEAPSPQASGSSRGDQPMVASNLVLIAGAGGVGRTVLDQLRARTCPCARWSAATTIVRLSCARSARRSSSAI